MSHPARGAWIEIMALKSASIRTLSHPARGAWIEMDQGASVSSAATSHPARGAWIEIGTTQRRKKRTQVAPRKGRVD